MRFLIFIYGEKYGKRFLLSEDANQKCRIILTKDEFSIEQTMFLELEYIMQEWYIKETKQKTVFSNGKGGRKSSGFL